MFEGDAIRWLYVSRNYETFNRIDVVIAGRGHLLAASITREKGEKGNSLSPRLYRNCLVKGDLQIRTAYGFLLPRMVFYYNARTKRQTIRIDGGGEKRGSTSRFAG